eukprot:GHVR01126999.1.p1 GENE.GHVR01126999.1~~GHVR01126999.1.p1  ORF type:complete len:214 (-),score=32.24 GHVR01126999.1:373-1014(-)
MATVQPRHERNDPNAGMQGAYYTVDIAMSGFLDTETVNGGRLSPCAANDFATKPTTLAQSLLVSRAQLRYKLMLNNLQIRSNLRIINMVTTYASDAGDSPITDINFGIVFENDDFVPTTGSTIDGSTTTTTKVLYIQDKIAEALNTTHTENMTVYDPTSNQGLISNDEVTVGPVLTASIGEIVEAITVAEVAGFRANVDAETPTDNALTYSAE